MAAWRSSAVTTTAISCVRLPNGNPFRSARDGQCRTMRIGFLFNHDQIHQVAHSLPIALALARGGFEGEILVATTSEPLAREVQRLGGSLIGTRIQHVELGLTG